MTPASGPPKLAAMATTTRKISRLHRPEDMTLEAWQAALRRQYGREQDFRLRNLGDHPVFSEFEVANPRGGTYRVLIRGADPGDNHCTCPDFATNTLGTCKHVEFTLGRLERSARQRSLLARGAPAQASEVFLHYGARREVRFRPGAGAPTSLRRLAARHFDAGGVLRPEGFAAFDGFLAEASRLEPGLRCGDEALGFVAEVRDGEQRARRLQEAFPRGPRSAAFQDLLRVALYPYQREAALFAARAGRCLIADEMGLGKTAEALAAAEIMARVLGVERALIVCPTSLKHQWEREIGRMTGRSVQVIGGFRPRRQDQFATATFFKVMNYDTVHRDLDLVRAWAPDLVVLDEAQRIKNWNTRTARHVKRIESTHAIVLTGTPIENRIEELVSLVDFVDRHRLGPTFRLLHEHQVRDESGRVVGYRDLDRLGQTLAPILLRRRKAEVLDQLPARTEQQVLVPMTPEQMQHHEENRETVARIVAKWRRHRFLSEADQRRLTIALQNMRMSCDSSYLLDQRSDHGVKADELLSRLEEVLEPAGAKAVVFSQWVRMLELVTRRLERRRWGHVVFHGGVDGQARRGLVDRFRQDDRCRLFLSTDAGGVGLNLQHASVVANLDLPWNPAVLEQRIGRVHRLGQTRPVHVLNFVARGTIEEGMLEVLRFKRSLFAGVLDGGEREVFLGGTRLTRFMESVDRVTTAIPAAAVESANGDAPGPEPVGTRAAGPTAALAAGPAGPAAPGGSPVSPADPLGSLIETGLAVLKQLAGPSGDGAAGRALAGWAQPHRDERTGERYLKLRLPEPAALERAAQAVQALLASLRG